ncbi:assimilatory nitrate reductase NasA [Natranaeroarchaeum aerophilus]|uniref:Molybdopterin-dependent oxidoreductase n=1 Tax=Natranaeroarchaeum aerophilus TaxID=2917711 RepID=A0AAE3K5M6_9EURY|nr:assimilatory nitrate reductase NasA [Natranaeroarchaeum aerophilus]MCL9814091.1 molybdopterin-dependent oxidoreductase [Natranaeroarchaeum aerophilus]
MSRWIPTTCMRCAVGCGHLQRGVDKGYGLDTVRGDASHPVNNGLACQRGVNETANPDGEWLTRPLIRKDDELVPTSWDTALGVVVERFRAALDTNPDGIAVLGSGQQTNEAAYALGKLARGGFGTRYYDANTTLCMASAVTAYYQAFGSDAPPPTYDDIPEAKTHLVWGANPAAAHPVMYRWIADSAADDDSQMIVVDPVASETVDDADEHVQLEPGTDLAFARAILAQLVEDDAIDESFIESATVGFDRLREELPPVESAAATAGVSVETVERVAAAFEDPTLVYWGMGINQSVQGTATARALIDLCLATGNLRPGSGPFSLTGQANSMGTRLCSSKGTWPGHRPFDAPEHRETVAETWGVPVDRLPDDPGPGPVGIVDALAEDGPEACWTVATNPVAGMPDADRVNETLSDTFLVVQDAFMTETAELADVVLPAATWGESEGTVTNMERTVSRVRAATETPPKVRQDIDIIATIGHRLDDDLFERPVLEPESAYEEFRELTADTPADLSGITYERLESELAVRWPAPGTDSQGGYRYYSEDGWRFPTDSGRAQFSTGMHGGLAEPADEQYPLTLTTGREPDAYNTGVRTRGEETTDLPVARIHPETTMSHSEAFERGETVVASRRASVTVSVQPDEGIPEGVIWLPIHHPAVNTLTLPTVDPESDEPNFKQCAVRLRAPADN